MTNPWSPEFTPPPPLVTDRMALEPLAPEHTERDRAAIMGSLEYLRRTIHWGPWLSPAMGSEEYRRILVRHREEFERRERFVYAVLSPDRQTELGNIYLGNKAPGDQPRPSADLTFWVVESEVHTGFAEYMLRQVLDWITQAWPFESVVAALHPDNVAGIATAEAVGLTLLEGRDFGDPRDIYDGDAQGRLRYLWRRS